MKKILILFSLFIISTIVYAESFKPGYILEAKYKIESEETVSGILIPENIAKEDMSVKYVCKKIAPSSNGYVEFIFSAYSFNAPETSLFVKKDDEIVFKFIYYTNNSFFPYHKKVVIKIVSVEPNLIQFEVIKSL